MTTTPDMTNKADMITRQGGRDAVMEMMVLVNEGDDGDGPRTHARTHPHSTLLLLVLASLDLSFSHALW